MIQFTFQSLEPKIERMLAIWAGLAGLNEQEVIHAINQGIASGHGELNIHGPKGTIQTDLLYARTLVGR